MNNPLLIVITGRPALGKTTLAHILSNELKFPLLSRDEVKEGYINSTGVHHEFCRDDYGLLHANNYFM